jgi:hypothetical protein
MIKDIRAYPEKDISKSQIRENNKPSKCSGYHDCSMCDKHTYLRPILSMGRRTAGHCQHYPSLFSFALAM